MAVGLTPKFQQDIPLEALSPKHFLVIAIEAARKLEWSVNHLSDAGLIATTPRSWNTGEQEVTLRIKEEGAHIKSELLGRGMVDWGKNKKNVKQFIEAFDEIKYQYNAGQLDKMYEELENDLVPPGKDVLLLPPAGAKDFFRLFVPSPGYTFTPVIVLINIAVFIIMVACGANLFWPDNESLIKWGANFKPLTLEGEWWRLLTNCFVHIGIIHLIFNMFALVYIGLMLEPRLGKGRYLSAYLLTGIVASITSLWWHDNTVSAGASGAIFGLYGVFFAMLTTNAVEKEVRKPLLGSIGMFIFYNLAVGVKGGIDNAAHIGGLVSGFVIGYAFYPSLKRPEAKGLKLMTILFTGVAVLSVSFIVYTRLPNDMGTYEKAMNVFFENEQKAVAAATWTDTTANDVLLTHLKDDAIPLWQKNEGIASEMKKLSLPKEMKKRNQALLDYTGVRIQWAETMCKAIAENTNAYDKEIQQLDSTLGVMLDKLNRE